MSEKYFGDKIDLYGRGIYDFKDKWQVLAPYKYSICIENSRFDDYFTEKLADCYLAHTFPLYYGCPNIENYFSAKAYQEIDIENIESTKQTIENILNNDSHYDCHLPDILQAKQTYLTHYQLFPLIVNYLEKAKNHYSPSEPVKLRQNFLDPLSIIDRTIKKFRKLATGV